MHWFRFLRLQQQKKHDATAAQIVHYILSNLLLIKRMKECLGFGLISLGGLLMLKMVCVHFANFSIEGECVDLLSIFMEKKKISSYATYACTTAHIYIVLTHTHIPPHANIMRSM